MTWDLGLYYFGYVIALVVCRGLGNLFFIPMSLNMGFNVALNLGLFSGFDTRWLIAIYGFLFFLWIAALAGVFDRVTMVALLVVELFAVFHGLEKQFQMAGTGQTFWHFTSTIVLQIWLLSVMVVSLSAIVKSSVVSMRERGYSELLIIPKRRFLIPVALWAAVWVLPNYIPGVFPHFIVQHRSQVAGQLLVWGWVAIELPFYIMYKRGNGSHK